MKTIYLHIGTPKTGTTHIQAYFAHNRARLLDDGVCYLADKEGLTSHGVALSLGCWEAHPPDAHHESLQWFQQQLRTALASPAERIVISSEMFCEVLGYRRLGMIKRLHATLTASGPARIVVVCYLRRQDLFVESRQAHDIVRCGVGYPVANLAPEMLISYADYYKLLSDYREVFGPEIIVRPFEKRQLVNGDVLDDFLHVIGRERNSQDTLPSPHEHNQRLRGDLVELLRLYNASSLAEPNDPLSTRRPFLPNLFTPEQLRQGPGARFLTLAKSTRAEILKRYAASNRKVAVEFLGRKDGKLFRDPVVTECADSKKGRTLQLEEVTPLLMHMITGVFAQSELLKPRLTALESGSKQMREHSAALEQRLQAADTRIDQHLNQRLQDAQARIGESEARTAYLESQLREAIERCGQLERQQRELQWRLACQSLSGRKLIGWGTNAAFRINHFKNPVPLAYLIDNDSTKWGQTAGGVAIEDPARLENEHPSDVAILVYSSSFDAIAAQIAAIGPFIVIPADMVTKFAPRTRASIGRKATTRKRRRLKLLESKTSSHGAAGNS